MPTIIDAATMNNLAYHVDGNDGLSAPTVESGYTVPNGWSLYQVHDDTIAGGDYGAIFRNTTTNEFYYACRGTVASKVDDLSNDAGIVIGVPPKLRIDDAVETIAELRADHPTATVTGGGHSLGGDVMTYVSQRFDEVASAPNSTAKPLDVLVENGPNGPLNNTATPHVTEVRSKNDIIGGHGRETDNDIVLNGPLKPFGPDGAHSVINLNNSIAQNPALANWRLGTKIDPALIKAGGGVYKMNLRTMSNNNSANDPDTHTTGTVTENPDGSITGTITSKPTTGKGEVVTRINVGPNGNTTVEDIVRNSVSGAVEKVYYWTEATATGRILTPNQNRGAAPTGTNLTSNQFYTSQEENNLTNIAFAEGINLSDLLALNSSYGATTTIANGTTINLTAINNAYSPTIMVTSNPQPQTTVAGENTASNNVSGGYIDLTLTESIAYSNGILNATDEISATEASMASGGVRPGEVQRDPNPFYGNYYSDLVKVSDAITKGLETSNLASKDANLAYIDPILMDLTGQGIQTTSESTDPIFFDSDNSETLKQTAWTKDGNTGILVVPDENGDVTNMSQLFSEYYEGAAGTAGEAGEQQYVNGFDALLGVDSNHDGIITSADNIWGSLRVWEDANHNAKVDSGELKTLLELGITQFNLQPTKSTDVQNGNPTTAVSSFIMNGQSHTLADVNLIHSDASHSLAVSGTGQIDTVTTSKTDSSGTTITTTEKTYFELGTAGKSLNAATLSVNNITGGSGNDSLQAVSSGSWLQGNDGSNTYLGGTGNDVFVVSGSDNPDNIHGNGGQDQLIITGTNGMSINMAQAGVEITQGGSGNDVIMSGGRTGVYIKGGTGTDLLIGGAGNDVIVGGSGHNTIVGGTGQAVIYAGPNGDLIYGAAKNSVINAGGGQDTIIAGAGDDLIKVGMGNAQIDGGDGTNLLQFHGSYGDYKIIKTTDGYIISDKIANRDGTVFVKNIQKLNFSDIQAVSLTSTAAMPVSDMLSKDSAGNVFDHTQSHTITASSLLANDQLLGSTTPLHITALKDVVGGTATINSSGNVVFTPTAGYTGMMSFKYTVSDAQNHTAATIVDNTTGQSASLYARVTLQTPDLPTDPLTAQEWYLNDTNVIPVWKDYTGQGIRVGQFEPAGPYALGAEVLNYNHPDLQANIDQSWYSDLQYRGILPTDHSAHATLVAGIIAASKDGVGSVGVAYNSTIGGYSLSQDNPLPGLESTADYDVVNNSFGFKNDFSVSDTTSNSTSEGNLMAAIQLHAETYGRGGKGVVVVTGAGNNRSLGGSAQGSTYNRSRFAIEVGAINQQADLSTLSPALTPFSNPGASILVSAPGSNIAGTSQLVVTDQGSIYGSNYTTSQGTSFATPIVSGIAALMLQANPNLGYRDVQAILALSAKKITDSATTWNSNHATNWNGSGMHYSYDYGFGEVDALAATRLAETWIPHSTTANESFVSASNSTAVTITAGHSTTKTLSMASGIKVEHAEIDLSLSYGHLKDITATLISPSGTQSILLKANDPSDTSTSLQYTFMSTQEWGEQSAGTWQLQLQDASTGQSVTLNSWALRLYGSASNADDIYYYTNEYASTSTLSDSVNGTAGGKNTINASAVTGNSSVNLATGAANLGGTGLTISSPTNFNNVFTGDGNDMLVANNNLGILDGGRGANTLTGGTAQNLFVVHQRANGVDTINSFTASQGDKIDLVGFKGLSYNQLIFTQQGSDVTVSLDHGQTIVLKGVTLSSINSTYFGFQDSFVAPKIFTDSSSTDNTLVGSTSTITMTGGSTGGSLTSNSNHQLVYTLAGTPYAHDFATSDRFVVSSSASGISSILGFKSGIDKVDLSQLNIASQSDLVLSYTSGTTINDAKMSHGVLVYSISKQQTLVYFDSANPFEIKGSDFIFASGQPGNASVPLRIGTPAAPGTPQQNTTGSSDPNIIGSNNGVIFNGTTSITSSVDYTLPDLINNLILSGTKNLVGVGNNNGDTFTSNTGIDTLVGGTGNDTYIVNNSNDVIIENASAGTDSVQSSVSYAVGDNVENLTLTGSNGLLATGNSSNNNIAGSTGDDILDGLGGNDTLAGGAGNNTYTFDDAWGQDTINSSSYLDTVDLSAITTNANVTMWLTSGNEVTDGTNTINWSAPIFNILTGSGNDLINGDGASDSISTGAGNDTIYGWDGDDTLIGGTGNDSLDGGNGTNSYVFKTGWGNDTINSSSSTDFVDLRGVESNLNVVMWSTSGDEITDGVNSINWDTPVLNIFTGSGNDVINGDGQGDYVASGLGNDTLYGWDGNDTLDGGTGNDLLDGGNGANNYVFKNNWGNDTINNSSSGDYVDLSGVTTNLTVALEPSSGNEISDGVNTINWNNPLYSIQTGSGNDSVTGGTGGEYISTGDGNDTIVGNAGNDYFVGGTGSNTYIFSNGWGNDVIDGSSSTSDIVDLSAVTSNLTVTMWTSDDNEVSDGTNTIDWYTPILNIHTGSGGDTINGDGDSDFISTGAGSDIIYADNGNDTLVGSAGNDTLYGGDGNDVYQFGSGDGNDLIVDGGGASDTVSFDSSVILNSIAMFEDSSGNLRLGNGSNGDYITIQGQGTTNGNIERFQTSDGHYLTDADVNLVIQTMSSYASSHSISMTSLADVQGNANLMGIINAAWHAA